MTHRNREIRIGMRAVMAIAALLLATMALASPGKTPITMNDLLNADAIGDAVFSPDGQSFVFTRRIPIAQLQTWGYDGLELVGTQVFVMGRNDRQPRQVPGTDSVRYSLLPERAWAPDGRGLLLMATTREGYGLAYYDLASGKVTVLPGYPDSSFPTFDWTADGRVVYAILPEGGHQQGANNQVLRDLSSKWDAAWNGQEPQVTVSSADPVFKTSELPPGALMLADPRNGAVRKLADGDYTAIAIAHDDRHFAAVRASEPQAHSFNFLGRRGELEIFALKADDARLTHGYSDLDVATYGGLAWSPSGQQLLAIGRPTSAEHVGTNLYRIDADNGNRHQLATEGLSFAKPGAGDIGMMLPIGWIGNRPVAVAAHAGAATPAPRNPGTAVAQLDYGETQDLRLDLYAFDGGRGKNLTAFAKASVNQFLVPSDKATAIVAVDGALWKVAPDAAQLRISPKDAPPIVGIGTDRRYPAPPPHSAYYRSGEQERVALYVIAGNGKPERWVLDIPSGRFSALKVRGTIMATAPDQLTTLSKVADGWKSTLLLNDPAERTLATANAVLEDKAVASASRFDYSYKGRSLTGWVVMPPNAKPGEPLPAIVTVYGGAVYGEQPPSNAKAEADAFPIFSGQLLAAQGYAVVYPSTPLGPGSDTDVMATLADESVAAIDALVAQGLVDPQRVGVTGQSFGGYSTAAILAKRSDRFKAGIAMAGIYDWIFSYGMAPMDKILAADGNIANAEMKMVESGQIQLAKPFWQAPAAYMRNSPAFHVEDIDAPLLLLHGDLDMGSTGIPGAERMYNLLLRAGKRPVLVRYWGQGHVSQSAWAVSDQWQRITAWFGHYVKDTPSENSP